MTAHQEQIASTLKRAIQEVLSRGLSDPRVRGLISVTRVKVSPDLAHAAVGVSVLPAEHARLTLRGLEHAAKHIRSQVGRKVALRRMPRLSFHLDESLKKEAAVHAAISKSAASQSQQANDAPGAADGAPADQPKDASS